ncbi:MAG: sigma 54-interacting transcriptional regulator [Clostridiales Family XIII bacterium]|jgi:arginine utilization regulatory protein|nr:sigma 54-interacting transcriptional regulator [Clostridiales Family XIII bacterium]
MNMNYQDIVILDKDGVIIYTDVANLRAFDIPVDEVVGMKLSDLYRNFNSETSTMLKALKTGEATVDYEQTLETRQGNTMVQVGSTYPIMNGSEIVGVIEFSKYKYRLEEIGRIQDHWDKPIYRKNYTRYTVEDIITDDAQMLNVKARLRKAAKLDSPVFVCGKTGTGKELVVQSIHNLSKRAAKPFVSQNCGAIPENLLESLLFGTVKGGFTGAENKMGILEAADGGTVFLDEINALSPELQAKLLKVIEDQRFRRIGDTKEKEINVRFLAATNEDVDRLISERRFRSDLYYRLAVVQIDLPELAERRGDIKLLVNYYIDYYNAKLHKNIEHVPDDVLDIFLRYDWPGNVRELRNAVEGIFSLSDDRVIQKECLPKRILEYGKKAQVDMRTLAYAGCDLKTMLRTYEDELIGQAMEENEYVLSKAATRLGVSRQVLKYKLEQSKRTEKGG